jgi:hypothetical protein
MRRATSLIAGMSRLALPIKPKPSEAFAQCFRAYSPSDVISKSKASAGGNRRPSETVCSAALADPTVADVVRAGAGRLVPVAKLGQVVAKLSQAVAGYG